MSSNEAAPTSRDVRRSDSGLRALLRFGVLLGLASSACQEDHGAEFRGELGVAPGPGDLALERDGITVHAPPELTSLATGVEGPDGVPIRVACVSCHTVPGVAATFVERAEDLGPPHEGIRFEHGSNACASCHDPEERLLLRTADGRRVPMSEAIQLCAQCHGTQYRDFTRGAHGGMRGHWDLASGPRERNHCIDCHDAHRPAYPRLVPMPPPADRIRPARHGAATHDGAPIDDGAEAHDGAPTPGGAG